MCHICFLLDKSFPTAKQLAVTYVESLATIPESHDDELAVKVAETLKGTGHSEEQQIEYALDLHDTATELLKNSNIKRPK